MTSHPTIWFNKQKPTFVLGWNKRNGGWLSLISVGSASGRGLHLYLKGLLNIEVRKLK